MKAAVKQAVRLVFLTLAFPCAALCGFGRLGAGFTFWSHVFAQLPGLPGDYAREAYYRLTLAVCPPGVRICFGTFFSTPNAEIEKNVYIGVYCVIGNAHIGASTQIASSVHILSGRHHHARDSEGRILGAEKGAFQRTFIGNDCWLGESSVVMADVGAGSTVGAGSVVTKPIPPGVVAAGNPARVIKSALSGASTA